MAESDSLCPNCSEPLPPQFAVCPHCGVRKIVPHGYEWKSQGTWMGEPLIHIAFGCEPTGRPRTARGMIAIGQRAIGGIAIGIMAAGFVSIGVVAAGVFSIGIVAIGLAVACGVNAAGGIAIGVVAAGWKAGGVTAIGQKVLFSLKR
jgi:GLTT repeat (6 copies)